MKQNKMRNENNLQHGFISNVTQCTNCVKTPKSNHKSMNKNRVEYEERERGKNCDVE